MAMELPQSCAKPPILSQVRSDLNKPFYESALQQQHLQQSMNHNKWRVSIVEDESIKLPTLTDGEHSETLTRE